VSDPLNSLTDDEVRQITLLVETLDRSTFDFLQLDVGNLKVTIGKGNNPPMTVAPAAPSAPAPEQRASAPAASAPAAAAVAAAVAVHNAPAQTARVDAPPEDGTVTIVAPMMGRFYAKPEPGAAPFVAVGDSISADTTVALIEVMKVFTAVRAGVSGVITEICVQDAQFVEYEHVLFRVRLPDKAPSAAATGAKGRRK
jgi:acetyl-CoA carboxylase biotin carboxyl carrier protein